MEKKTRFLFISLVLLIAMISTGYAASMIPPGYTSIISMTDNRQLTIFDNTEIAYTESSISIPIDAYVNIAVSGEIRNTQMSMVTLEIDGTKYPETERLYSCGGNFCDVGFQTGDTYFLTKGTHIIKMKGITSPGNYGAKIYHVIVTAIVSQNGERSIKYY